MSDLRIVLRALRRSPGFTVVAVITLGLGIGANAAIFSVVNAVLLRSLPYPDADRVVMVRGADADGSIPVSELERLRYQRETGIFESFGTYVTGWANLTGGTRPERVPIAAIDANVLSALGVRPLIGRNFTPEEDGPDRGAVAILSHGLWQRRFGGTRDVLGETVLVNGSAVPIVGVLPERLRLPTNYTRPRTEVFVPLGLDPASPDPRNLHYMFAVARLRPDVSLEGARARLAVVGEELRREIGTLPAGFTTVATPVRQQIFGDIRPALLVLLGAVGLVLLIACVNVANLLLARSESRLKEFSVRAALGAGRGRLMRGILAESLTLSLLGGALGILLAAWAVHAVDLVGSPHLPRADEIGLDLRVVGFTGGMALLTALVFGTVPALQLSRVGTHAALRATGRGATGGGGDRLRRGLMVAEMALAVTLAIGAGLLIKSFMRLQAVETGFRSEGVLTMQITLPGQRYPDAASARAFYRQLLRRVRALPGVETAGAVSHLPLNSDPGDWGIRIEGREEERLPSGRRPWADWVVASDGYFEAMGMQLKEGRLFDASDDVRAAGVVVVNETLAERYWPDRSAVGRRFKMSSDIDTIYRTVVGVVGDVRHEGLDAEVQPQMFLPQSQFPATADFPMLSMSLVIRTSAAPLSLAPAVRAQASAVDPDVPVSTVRPMDRVVETSTAAQRLNVSLFAAFGLAGLVLVAVGVYGVMAYLVAQRTREFGIRAALGAAPRDVLHLVVGQGMSLSVVGVALGVLGALALGRVLAGLLFGVSAQDLSVYVAVPALLTAVALLACVVPARRAVRVDPVEALRAEG